MSQKRVNLFGVVIDDIPIDRALSVAEKAMLEGDKMTVFTPNVEILSGALESSGLKALLNSATLLLPDGFYLRAVSALVGRRMENTVAGIDFGMELIRLCAKEGRGVFLVGGERNVGAIAAKRLKDKMPDLNICGVHNGYFDKEDEGKLIERIDGSGAALVVVCMGFPRQEIFAQRLEARLKGAKIIVCLGGSIDVWAGKARRAPMILQVCHLEWLWRILNEPKRALRLIRSLGVLVPACACEARSRFLRRNK